MTGPLSKALEMTGTAPGGAFTKEQMRKYRNRDIRELAALIPPDLRGLELAEWILNHSKEVVELIRCWEKEPKT